MFGLSLLEIAFVIVLFVIFVKPKDIPSTIQKLAYYLGRIRRAMQEARDMVDDIKNMAPPPSPPTRDNLKDIDVKVSDPNEKNDDDTTSPVTSTSPSPAPPENAISRQIKANREQEQEQGEVEKEKKPEESKPSESSDKAS